MTKRLLTLPFLILLALILVFTGCKLDDAGFTENSISNGTGTQTDNSLILGMWYVKKQTVFNDPVFHTYDVTSFTNKDYYLFNSDKSFKFSSSAPDLEVTSHYVYDGSAKTLSFGPDPEDNYTIDKLTTDSLIMSSIISGSAGGATTIDKITFKLARK